MGFNQQRARRDAATTAAVCAWLAAGCLGLPPTLAGLGLAAAPARADDSAPGKTVNMDLAAADIHTVVNLLCKQTGAEVTIQDGDKAFGKVNVFLHGAPLEKALRQIALSADAVVSRDADGVYIIRHAAADPAPGAGQPLSVAPGGTATAPASPAAADSAPARPRIPEGDLSWRKLSLQHAVPTDILKTMQWPPYNDPSYREISAYEQGRAPQPTQNVNVSNPNISTLPLYGQPVPANAQGAPGADARGAGAQANRTPEPGSTDQARQFPGGGIITGGGGGFPGGFGGGGGFPGGFGGGGGFPGGGGFQPPGGFGGNQAGGFGGAGGAAGQTNLPEGVERIYALQGDNSLFIQATPDGFNRVRDIVKNLDIAPRQVQIKVEFITASVNDVDQFGINFDIVPYPGVEASSGLTVPTTPTFGLQVASGNIVAQLFANLTKGRSKVVQSPLITTTNNTPALISQQQQIPYTTTTNIVGNGGQTVSNNQTNFLQVSTFLSVTPRINSDDTVTLNLQPNIVDVGSASPGLPPPTTNQNLTTLRTVRSGETMVLGGLIRKSEISNQAKIPILGDLPIIGGLFRSRDRNVSDSELLIFVTPTILPDSNNVNTGTSGGPNISVAP